MRAENVVSQVKDGVVKITAKKGVGSGTLVSPQAILTNAHVVEATSVVILEDAHGRQGRGRVIWRHRRMDLAVIKALESGWDAGRMRVATQVREGEEVLAMGFPFGQGLTVTHGIVSAHSVKNRLGVSHIQIDAALNAGSSGGPVVNMSGEVVALSTFKSDGQSLNFAIPMEAALRCASNALNQAAGNSALCCPACGQYASGHGRYCMTCGACLDVDLDAIGGVALPEPLLVSQDTAERETENLDVLQTRPGQHDPLATIRQAIIGLLDSLGVDSYEARMERNLWVFLHGSINGEIGLVENRQSSSTSKIFVRCCVIPLPDKPSLAFYRKLLQLNDEFLGNPSFSVDAGNMVWLSTSRPVEGLDGTELSVLFHRTSELADKYDDELLDEFGAELGDDQAE